MKCLYVRTAYRRLALSRQLTEGVLEAAHVAGYHSVLLDTLDDMEPAQALYAALGFVDIRPTSTTPWRAHITSKWCCEPFALNPLYGMTQML